MINDKLDIH